MRVQDEKRSVTVIAIIALCAIFCLRCFNESLDYAVDASFLYNRLYQMVDCLKHGFWPFLYYNDAGGIGYGSPIFYGQLTLVPFIPFVSSLSLFIRAYYLACLLLNFAGFRFFLKRLSSYATLCSIFYIISMPFVYLYGWSLQASCFATGLSWFFFGYCIDFFRDRRHFAQTAILFYLVYQSNLNSAIFAVLVCFCLFLAYFDKERIKDYAKLFVCEFLLLLYNIVNVIVHLDSLRGGVEPELFGPAEVIPYSFHLMSSFPFGEYIIRTAVHDFFGVDMCCGLMTFSFVAVFVYFIVSGFKAQSRRFRVCTVVIVGLTAVGYAVGIYAWWPSLYYAMKGALFFQFPIRYMILLYGFLIAVLSKVIKWDDVLRMILAIGIADMVFAGPLTWQGEIVGNEFVDPIHYQIMNAEYAGPSFINERETVLEYSSCVHSESGAEYAYENLYNGLSVDCSSSRGGDVLTLPKLYYNGYQAFGDGGEAFGVVGGYSNYCQVDIGGYKGTLRLEYRVHPFVMACFALQIGVLLYLLMDAFRRTVIGGLIYSGLIVCLFYIQLAFLWVVLKVRLKIFLFWRKKFDRYDD